jgi:hypothetical protein
VAAGCSDMLVALYQTTQHQITENHICRYSFGYPFGTERRTHIQNVQCDAQNAEHHINIPALLQLQFKFLSSAYQYGHLIPGPKGGYI